MTKSRAPVFRYMLTTLLVLWGINLVASLLIDGRALQQRLMPTVNAKSRRASLEDRELAEKIYREFRMLDTRYVPFVEWSREPFSGEVITVNEDGDRVHAPTTETPLGHVRFFGGSTMWGSGVDDESTIPAHFNALHPDYAVHNHGESGFVSRQALARLINLVNQEEPMDLVVFYDGCNDVYTLCREDISMTGHREEPTMARKLEKGSATANELYSSTLEVAHAIGTALNLIDDDPGVLCGDPEHARRVARTVVNNWKIARDVAQRGGAEFHAFLQPVATLGTPNIEYLGDRKTGTRAECYLAVYPILQEIIGEEGGGWMHDLTDVFDVDEYIYIDSCHVNSRGNRIVAGRMDSLIGEALRRNE